MKRIFDIIFAVGGLIVLSPLILILAIAVRLVLGSPVLYSQVRPGYQGQHFVLHKFRSMIDSVDAEGNDLPDEARLGKFGRVLRATSLDELPTLWNVVRGDMSIVGPRPLLVEYLQHYTPQQMRRHEVRPGITGWAQVNGRNALSWEEKFELDVWYVDNQSLLLDLRIIAMTVIRVFRRDGISHAGEATMPRFTGRD